MPFARQQDRGDRHAEQATDLGARTRTLAGDVVLHQPRDVLRALPNHK